MKLLQGTASVYMAEPDTVDVALCAVCKSHMSVIRNVEGPTGWAMAMARKTKKHDLFTCPFRNDVWHVQVTALMEEAVQTPSKKIETILMEEAESILANRRATKQIERAGR